MRLRLGKLLKTLLVVVVFGCVFLFYIELTDVHINNAGQNGFAIKRVIDRVAVTQSHEKIAAATTAKTPSPPVKETVIRRVGGDCHSLIVLPHDPDESWQKVDKNKDVYSFSAYLEGRSIRIIGVKTSKNIKLFCQLYYGLNTSDPSMKIVDASATAIPEGHGRRYTATQFFCTLPDHQAPCAVSLVDTKCINASNAMAVRSAHLVPRRNFSVCTTPLNYGYNRAHELVEWIEMNRILGAEFFTFYNYTSGPAVDAVLNFYRKRGVVEVIPWRLPMGVDTWPKRNTPVEIHYFGQLASSNDCLRRNREITTYLAVIDLDEFIIPRGEGVKTWTDMMKGLPNNGAYFFCNTFFRKEWNNTNVNFSNKEDAVRLKLTTLLKLDRESKIAPHSSRSKYIVKPKAVEVLGIHNIWRMSDKHKHYNVPNTAGLLHHYRNWENPFEKVARTTDKIVLDKFGPVLMDTVSQVWRKLEDNHI